MPAFQSTSIHRTAINSDARSAVTASTTAAVPSRRGNSSRIWPTTFGGRITRLIEILQLCRTPVDAPLCPGVHPDRR